MNDYTKLMETSCFLFDMDGTIYLDDKLLPGTQELLAFLDANEVPYFFLTNNSSKSQTDYVKKLDFLGIPTPKEKIFSSGEATAIYINKQKPKAKLYMVGTPSLEEEFTAHGFELVQDNPDFAVLGFDTTLTYEKLWKICDFVREGKPFIATHPDLNCPTGDGFMPDIGSMIALIATSTGKEPDVIVGKPNQPMTDAILEKTGFQAKQLTMVGDRLYTDIAMGKTGITTVLVLSGEAKLEDLPNAPHKPDYIMKDLAELFHVFSSQKNK